MNAGTQESLGTILLRYNLISEEDLHEALEEQKRSRGRLGETLVRLGYLKEDVLTWCLANQLNIPCVSTIDTRPDHLDLDALNKISPAQAYRHRAIPLLFSGNELTLVTDDPLDVEGLRELEQATGLRLNVAAGPTSEILSALRDLYGPDPDVEFEIDEGFDALETEPTIPLRDLLSDWLNNIQGDGYLHFTLEPRSSGGQMRPGRNRSSVVHPIDAELYERLIQGLAEAAGLPRITGPVMRPFVVGSHQGTVAFGQGRNGPMAVVTLEDAFGVLSWPSEWSTIMRQRLHGPGLWLLGVSSSRLWKPIVRTMTAVLEPEIRVMLAPSDELLATPQEGAQGVTPEVLEGLLGLEPDLLLLPAQARPAVLAHLQGGLPEVSIGLQVASRSPFGALQILRSHGVTGPEMAGMVRGVVCISVVDQLCSQCRSQPESMAAQNETPLRWAAATTRGCSACHGTGVSGDLPLLSWMEIGPELKAALSADRPISELRAAMPQGPVPTPRVQLSRYLEQELVSAKTVEAFMAGWTE